MNSLKKKVKTIKKKKRLQQLHLMVMCLLFVMMLMLMSLVRIRVGYLIQELVFILLHVEISFHPILVVILVGLPWEMKQSVRLWA